MKTYSLDEILELIKQAKNEYLPAYHGPLNYLEAILKKE